MGKMHPAEIAAPVTPPGKNCRNRQNLPGVMGN
jgi:hypothetical protein